MPRYFASTDAQECPRLLEQSEGVIHNPMKEEIMNTIESTARISTSIVVECTEPKCASFGTGHETYDAGNPEDNAPIHELEPIEGRNYMLTVQRGDWDLLWTVDIDMSNNDPAVTPDEAVTFAADMLKTSATCRALNSTPTELSTVTRVLDIAASFGVEHPDPREILAALNA